MKSPLFALLALLAVGAVAASAAPAPPPKLTKWQQQQQEKFKNSAPADEYFGRMKMSFLGMNNTFRDSAISSGDHTTDPAIINKVALAEDALEAWARKYPRDPQLARTYYLATLVDRKIWVKANQDRAWVYLNRLVSTFPDTYFGKLLKRDLAIGFTEHYYALPVPCATGTPSPSPSPGDASAAIAPIAAATDTPAPEPSASPTPTPGPQTTTVAKGLRVEIIPQACVPPATPTPSPSPAPSATPTPTPTPADTPSAQATDTPAPQATGAPSPTATATAT